MGQMKTPQHQDAHGRQRTAMTINSNVTMEGALINTGNAIMIMIVETDQMKAKSVAKSTPHVLQQNLDVPIPNVSI